MAHELAGARSAEGAAGATAAADADGAPAGLGPGEPGAASHSHSGHGGRGLLALSFAALGTIYGDIGTSPLYAYQSVFADGTPSHAQVLSAASLFFWTLTLIVLVKYVAVVIRLDDNGEGGTFALYSLVCRAGGFTPFGPAQPEEEQLAADRGGRVLGLLPPGLRRLGLGGGGSRLRRFYHTHASAQVSLLLVVMVATAMVIGDGVLTPSISVLSAVSGLRVGVPAITQPQVIGVTIAVLVLLFCVQYLGTGAISTVFAPIVTAWLLFNAAIGLFNLSTCGWGVWQAVSPHHAIYAFMGGDGFVGGWRLLAGVMLCVTGAEAMFADLGHFSAAAVRLSFVCLVYPTLVVTYMGQAAYLLAHPEAYTDPFWLSLPRAAFWPMLVVASAASVVASQALISGVFSIMRQAMNLGVFPPMRISHTDARVEGQIYIRQINYGLLLGCIAMVAGFQDTTAMGHAYGVAVMSVMFITTFLAGLVMLARGASPLLVALFVAVFAPLEGLFLSSTIIKIAEGGWVTLMIAALVTSVNLVWWQGSKAKSAFLAAQAARHKALLTQLPLSRALSDEPPSAGAGAGAPAAAAAGGGAALRQRSSTGAAGAGGGTIELQAASAPLAWHKNVADAPAAAAAAAADDGRISAKSWSGPSRSGRLAGLGSVSSSALMFNHRPLTRLPGLCIVLTQATRGLPAVLQHLLVNMPVLHDVCVLLTVRHVQLPWVDARDRFMCRRSRRAPGIWRVIARYGYMEGPDMGPAFVRSLLSCLVRFVCEEGARGSPAATAGAAAVDPDARSPFAGTAAAAVPAGDAIIDLQQLHGGAEAAAAAAPAGDDALEAWASVAADPEEDPRVMAAAAAAAAPDLAVRSFTSGARSSGEPPASPAARQRARGAPSQASQLGRESINRREAGLQHAASRVFSSLDGAPSSAGAPAAIPSERPLSFAAEAAALAGRPAGRAGAARVGLDPEQLAEVERLLSCYTTQRRTVFILGASLYTAAAAPEGAKLTARARAVLRRGLAAAFGLLSSVAQSPSSAWQLPDEEVLMVALRVRL